MVYAITGYLIQCGS